MIFIVPIVIATAPEFRALAKERRKKGITNVYSLFEPYNKKIQYIYPAAPELDFPLKYPSNVTLCGPILLPIQPVHQADSNLRAWLKRAPTVLIHFGSHFVADLHFAHEMAGAIRIFLDKCPDTQVLWKLIKHGKYDDCFSKILSGELSTDRVRISGWLEAEPFAILQTGHISCVVHHGGATSYYGAIPYVAVSPRHSIEVFLLIALLLGLVFCKSSVRSGSIVWIMRPGSSGSESVSMQIAKLGIRSRLLS